MTTAAEAALAVTLAYLNDHQKENPMPVTDATKNPENPKQRYGDLKPNLALVPPSVEVYLSLALGDGARKYGPYNWRAKPVEAMTYVAALRRHMSDWLDGEELTDLEVWNDEQGVPHTLGGKPHLAAALACIAILVDALENGQLIDNRPKTGNASALVRKWSKEPVPLRAEPINGWDVVNGPGQR